MEKDALLCYEHHVFCAINTVLEACLPREFASVLEGRILDELRCSLYGEQEDDNDNED
jgi:hypothetical protein